MIQFDGFNTGAGGPGRQETPAHCIACEELLADALDGSLGAAEQSFFDRHLQTCVDCSQMVADAQRGAAWLELLKEPRPEPTVNLLERILAQTSGAEAGGTAQASRGAVAMPFIPAVALPTNLLVFRPRKTGALNRLLLEPRLAMTAAMAFFSIALTLNLTGVRLGELRARDLTPTAIRHSFYEQGAQAVRYYDGLRVVHVVESRVEDLREQNAEQQMRLKDHAPAPPAEEPKQKKAEPGPGSSRRESPMRDSAGSVVACLLLWNEEGGLV